MTSISKSFTAVGLGTSIGVKSLDSFTYSVSGTFVGTVILERSADGGQSFQAVLSKTAAASGTILVEGTFNSLNLYRFRCSAFTSGTIVTVVADADKTLDTFTNDDGVVLRSLTESGYSVLRRVSQSYLVPAVGLAKAGTTAGFVVAAGDNVGLVTLPASQTASTLVLPIVGLKVGMTITGFHLIGQIESAGGAVTVDADLRKHTAAAADVADASVGAITQLAVVADTIISSTNSSKSSLTEVVGADETFYLLITATTAASTDIALQGVVITVTEV